MRITGLATGLDMDQIIRDSMKPYRIKIDQQAQKKEIVEIKQKLYREVIKDSRDFYNKYFDITSKDNLMMSSSFSTVKYTSSNENILSVSGAVDAKAESYTITGTTAKPARATIVSEQLKDKEKISINGQSFDLVGENEREIAANLNKQLKEKNIDITVRYTDLASTDDKENKSGLIFESNSTGKDATFTLDGTFTTVEGALVEGKDKTAATVTGLNVQQLKDNNGVFKINGKEFAVEVEDKSDEEIQTALTKALESEKISVKISKDTGEMTFTSEVTGKLENDISIEIGEGESLVSGVFENGKEATVATNTMLKDSLIGEKVNINGTIIDLKDVKEEEIVDHLNNALKDKGVTVSEKLNDKGEKELVFTANKAGASEKIEVSTYDKDSGFVVDGGCDTELTFKDSRGGVYVHRGSSNTVVLDGVTFKFTGDIPKDSTITVNGKKDVTELKDKIVNFVNDYNKLIEKLNTVTMERPNKEFMPLTPEQKKEMSDDEIKLWNEKVKKGQLSRDQDVTRIINSMKNAITTPVKGNSLNFEKLGIKPVADYAGVLNGTFTIDETKLTKALEENAEEVMNFFIGTPKDTDGMSDSDKYNSNGVLQRLKDSLYKETVSVSSPLIKKAGIEGSATASNNQLSRSMEQYEKKIRDMEKDFKRREQSLYSKYARLETMMNKYNSQQSYLMQQMGGM